MADVWVLQNSDKSVVGVFGTRGAANRGGGDEDARALPFDIIEPKAGAASPAAPVEPQIVEVPVEVTVEVPVPVYVPSDNADGEPLLAALNEIHRVLTSANAPKPILDAITKISSPAIDKYNSSAVAPVEAVSQPTAAPVEATPASTVSEEVDSGEALDFLLGEDDSDEPEEAAFVPVPVTAPVVEEPVGSLPAAPVTQQQVPEQEPEYEDEFEENVDSAPVSAFANRSVTGMGDIVSPIEDPIENPALTDAVIGLSSWLVAEQEPTAEPQQAPALTRRERREREEAQSAGDSSQTVVI